MSKDTSTEEKIKEAARRVFISKGFSGCSSREIAKEAGMNVALVNYYFRSKNLLFKLIFDAALEDSMLAMLEVFAKDLDLESKLRIFIEREYDFLSKHPEIPGFIINELTREGCNYQEKRNIIKQIEETGVFEQALAAQAKGEMRKIDIISITLLIMSNCQYPFMARPLMQEIHSISNEQYEQQLVLHKQYVTEMVIQFLFPKK
jgi:TetR/AcrR family transcriptional regulator